MSEFFTILPPPQSVETLDSWGSLDSLPFSLDDAKWQSVGIYGLVASEGGTSGQTHTATVKRGLIMLATAKASGSMEGVKAASIYELTGEATATASGSAVVTLVRRLAATGAAVANGKADIVRVLMQGMDGQGRSGDLAVVDLKGWGWDGKNPPSAPVWDQKNEQLTPWTQKQGGVAQWQ